jgi:hypothetical protein
MSGRSAISDSAAGVVIVWARPDRADAVANRAHGSCFVQESSDAGHFSDPWKMLFSVSVYAMKGEKWRSRDGSLGGHF